MPMKELLNMHNLIMRDILHKHNGYEVKTEGDAFMVAFQEAADGLSFALEAQQRLFDAAWPSWLLEDVILKDTGGRYRFGKKI
jgi:class 3 adenylate cyclase